MAKHLTSEDIRAIVNTLYAWEGELKWETVCDRVSAFVGKRPTRQSLSMIPEIKMAFHQAKRNAPIEKKPPAPSGLSIASARISRLESEIEALKKQNAALLERFLRWQYNAANKGINESQLDKPLPRIDRERSDEPLRPRLVKSKSTGVRS